MAVVALTSAKGAPGVSTAALAMTLLWPRPALLLEADPVGGSSTLAGYLRGTVDHSRGLLGLVMAHRHGELEQALWSQIVRLAGDSVPEKAGPADRWLLPGLSDAAQAPSTAALWGPLGSLLASLERAGIDVLIDAGRLGAAYAPTPLLRQADLVLLVLGTSLPAVAAVRARLSVLREQLAVIPTTAGPASGLGLLLVGEGRPYLAREISGSLGLSVVASLSWDPASAEVLAAGATPGRRFESSPLVRSIRGAISASQELIVSRRDRLVPPGDAGHHDATAGLSAASQESQLSGREASSDV